jgi:hypothetical protein
VIAVLTTRVSIALSFAFLCGLVGSASAGTRTAPAWTATFTDPAGDAPAAAPDVTKVAIMGDEATGTVIFAVTAAGYAPASPDGIERRVYVWLNTDKDDDTGSPGGNEYALLFGHDPAEPQGWWNIARWNGSGWESAPEAPTMSFTRGSDLTWTLNKSDLGGATGFAAYATTVTVDANGASSLGDVAPEESRWLFDIAGPARTVLRFVEPEIGRPTSVPRPVRAGKRVTVSFPVTMRGLDRTDRPPAGTIKSSITISGKTIVHAKSLKGRVARVSLIVPRTASGKRLSVKVTITAPSFRGEDGIVFDLSTGYMGIVATYVKGTSVTRVANLPVR